MLFAVFASNARKVEIEGTRAPYGLHLDYLKPLMEAGRVVLEGVFSEENGSLTIIEADSVDQVLQILEHDPYIAHNGCTEVQIKHFVQMYPRANGARDQGKRNE